MTGMKNQTCKRNSASDVGLICFFRAIRAGSCFHLRVAPLYQQFQVTRMWSVVDDSPGEATSWHCAGEVPRRVVHCVLLEMSVRRIYIQCWSPLQERTCNGTPVMTPNATQRDMTPQTNGMRRKSLPESAVVIQRGSAMISARRKASVAAETLARKSSQCITPAGMSRAKPGVVVGFIF